MKKHLKAGFTLIELLVVVLIIGILAAVALPQYYAAVQRADAAEMLLIAKAVAEANTRYKLANNTYTRDIRNLDIEFKGTYANPSGCTDCMSVYLTTKRGSHLTVSTWLWGNDDLLAMVTKDPDIYEIHLAENGKIECISRHGEAYKKLCESLGKVISVTTGCFHTDSYCYTIQR
jgi:prepilin-type N-terminal cleavage/methylation domain-containing protein